MITPDFSKPAFSFVALCGAHFLSRNDGGHAGPFRSDYRCQFRYAESDEHRDVDVRVYLVGKESVNDGDDVAIIIAFLDWERARHQVELGAKFELCEGNVTIATGVVHAIAIR